MGSSVSKYFTTQRSEDGVKFPLCDADGEDTGDWIKVRGSDSKSFRKAHVEYLREKSGIDEKELGQIKSIEASDQAIISFCAKLVVDWSFDEECNLDSVKEALENAPILVDHINQVAVKREEFLKKK